MQKIIKKLIIIMLIVIFIIPIINGKENSDLIIGISSDPEAPDPPTIIGPTEGKLHQKYNYEIKSEDPQCDNICYKIICSDMPVIYNSPFCESGETLFYNHSWDDYYQTESPYIVNAKAIDCHGHESEWSTFEVSISKNKIIINPIIQILNNIFQILIIK